MFRPLDTLSFDTEWPLMSGKISGMRDARVIVLKRPGANLDYPCNIMVSAVSSNSLSFVMASRDGSTVYSGTELVVILPSMTTGSSHRASNQYMTVDVVTDGTSFSLSSGTLPLQIIPCCVMWIPYSESTFTDATLPDPGDGWTRTIEPLTRRVIYSGWAPGAVSSDNPPAEDVVRLKLLNGMSGSGINLVADGEGTVDTDVDSKSIVVNPAMRDLTDKGRTL